MRRVSHHHRALVQRLVHQVNLPAGQVAHTAVHQLGGPAGGGLREVASFDECGAVAASSCVHGDAEAGRAAADDEYIEVVFQQWELFSAAFQRNLLAAKTKKPPAGSPHC